MKRVWSIACTDSSSAAGLAADQSALDAWPGTRAEVVSPQLPDAQWAALEAAVPPAALKTGLLVDATQMHRVAAWVDRLRETVRNLPLVVDPVLDANFADDDVVAAYRAHLLPRATLITPNRREAARLLGWSALHQDDVPAAAQALHALGAQAVCITGGDPDYTPGDATPQEAGLALDWLDSPHASGWLALPRIGTSNTHGAGYIFSSGAAAALAHGFVAADAVVLAKMAATHALRHGHAAGRGPGQVSARPGFHAEPGLLPHMGWGTEPVLATPLAARAAPLGLYAIVDSAARVQAALAGGVRSVQLRIKRPGNVDAGWWEAPHAEVAGAVEACSGAGARLFVNDHWQLAARCGAHGVHMGQEDLLALDAAQRAALRASGLALGISSHALWELARARSLAPAYIACGPVWPTLTKAMPWRAQGLDNLAWWCAMAGIPVVAIGGVLEAAQITQAAACGADGVCVVRMLGENPAAKLPGMFAALARQGPAPAPADAFLPWPQPSLSA